MKPDRSLLIALPFRGVAAYVADAVRRYASVAVAVTETQDFYGLKSVIRESDPDLVLTTPVLLSDPLLPLFKEDLEMEGIKYAAYCTTTAELQFLKNYDGKFTLSDTAKEVAQMIEELISGDSEVEDTDDPLTAREKDVVIAVVKGLTNKEIADLLSISAHTVITHRKNIARKLNIHSPAGLTVYAIMNKLVDLADIGD